MDRLSTLLERFPVRARLFHHGPLCGLTHFAAEPGRGFLHVLRRGEMELSHPGGGGAPQRLRVVEPSLLLYPRPLEHDFHNAPAEGSDFSCAQLEFADAERHPLASALPPFVCVPLREAEGLGPALELLFAELERPRCGQRLLVDRLFEVVLLQLLRWLLERAPQLGLPEGLLLGLADPALARCLVALHEAPGRAWTLEAMAAEAGLSRSAFALRFRQQLGCPPAEYLTRWRLLLAQQRLRAGAPLKGLAAELGYANPSALSRVFKAQLGCSVREWLAQIKP